MISFFIFILLLHLFFFFHHLRICFFLPKKFKNFWSIFRDEILSLFFEPSLLRCFIACFFPPCVVLIPCLFHFFYWFLMFNLLAVSLLISHVFFLFFLFLVSLSMFPLLLFASRYVCLLSLSLSCASSEKFSKKKSPLLIFCWKKKPFHLFILFL